MKTVRGVLGGDLRGAGQRAVGGLLELVEGGALALTKRVDVRLVELHQALEQSGTRLCFAELKDPVKDKFKRFGLFTLVGEAFFFSTVDAAVKNHAAECIGRRQPE